MATCLNWKTSFIRRIGYHSPHEEIIGIDALRAFIQALRAAFPDMHVGVTDQFHEGHKVCTRVVLTGTQLGAFNGIPPSGRSIQIDGVIISELTDGRITREWELLDQHSMLQQLDLLPTDDAA